MRCFLGLMVLTVASAVAGNSASREEILLVLGMGKRMLHEFKEYRPYTNMAQFREEIGNYVDQGEVERLVRYVVVR